MYCRFDEGLDLFPEDKHLAQSLGLGHSKTSSTASSKSLAVLWHCNSMLRPDRNAGDLVLM